MAGADVSYSRGQVYIYEDVNGGITCQHHSPKFNTDETIKMLDHLLDHVRQGDDIDGELVYAVAIRDDLSGR